MCSSKCCRYSLILLIGFLLATANAFGSWTKSLKTLPALHNKAACDSLRIDDGKTVIIFFESCCRPNERAMKWALELDENYPEKLNFVAVNLDKARALSRAKHWCRKHSVRFPVFSDSNHSFARVFAVMAAPCILILDEGGAELCRSFGFTASEGKRLKRLIRKNQLSQDD